MVRIKRFQSFSYLKRVLFSTNSFFFPNLCLSKNNPLGKRRNAVHDNPHMNVPVQPSNKVVHTHRITIMYHRREDHKLKKNCISSHIIFSSFGSDLIRIFPSYYCTVLWSFTLWYPRDCWVGTIDPEKYDACIFRLTFTLKMEEAVFSETSVTTYLLASYPEEQYGLSKP